VLNIKYYLHGLILHIHKVIGSARFFYIAAPYCNNGGSDSILTKNKNTKMQNQEPLSPSGLHVEYYAQRAAAGLILT